MERGDHYNGRRMSRVAVCLKAGLVLTIRDDLQVRENLHDVRNPLCRCVGCKSGSNEDKGQHFIAAMDVWWVWLSKVTLQRSRLI